jgi:hypothetical protein
VSNHALGRRRILWLLGLWALAALLIVGQFLLLRSLAPANRIAAMTDGRYVVPSEDWRLGGTLIPLLLMAAALFMHFRWASSGWRLLIGMAMFLFVPFAFLAMLMAAIHGPGRVDSVRLSTGQHYVLTVELAGFDAIFGLYESAGPTGLQWRRVAYLSGLEHDDPLVGVPRLAASPDQTWLLVRRDGLWTDCFRLVRDRPVECDIWQSSDRGVMTPAARVHMRSRRIAALTGLTP